MADLVIQEIDAQSPYLKHVQTLADSNASTLGFLPYQAFNEYARQKGILAAFEGNVLAGYLIYRIVKRENKAIIVHLCVDQTCRGKGVADQLFTALKERTQLSKGIGLHCRRDYKEASRLWERLGFVPQHDKPGRRQSEPSELTYWWFDHGHPTLFDSVEVRKLRTVIDANIFFDLVKPKSSDRAILEFTSDWLQAEIEIVVTDELFIEINRNTETHVREQQLRKAKDYARVKAGRTAYANMRTKMLSVLPTPANDNDESDINHLAWAAADPATRFYVTRDNGVLDMAPQIYEEFQLTVVHPVDLILRLDEYQRVEDYRHMRLAGTTFKQRRIQSGDPEEMARHFQNDAHENRADFLKELRSHLVNRQGTDCYVAEDSASVPLVLYVFERQQSGQLCIPLLRVSRAAENKKLLRYLLLQFVATAAQDDRQVIQISDRFLQPLVLDTLREDAFFQSSAGLNKVTLPVATDAQTTANRLEVILNGEPELKAHYQLHLSVLRDESGRFNVPAMAEIERVFWPLKVTDSAVSSITIPIEAVWASSWFDEDLASQTLFGAKADRAFNREGVYYSRRKPLNMSLPGRVLWYVTQEKRLAGAQAIRACSRLDSVVVGKPKDLFRQFRHLGIYEWHNIVSLVKGDLDSDITAYRFSDTQLFINPVSFEEWKQITQQVTGKEPPKYSATPMPNEVFEQVYKKGMGLT